MTLHGAPHDAPARPIKLAVIGLVGAVVLAQAFPCVMTSRSEERKQNALAILKPRRLNRFVIITTRNATADPRSSELKEQAVTVD